MDLLGHDLLQTNKDQDQALCWSWFDVFLVSTILSPILDVRKTTKMKKGLAGFPMKLTKKMNPGQKYRVFLLCSALYTHMRDAKRDPHFCLLFNCSYCKVSTVRSEGKEARRLLCLMKSGI